ncbi:MAG TPA: glycosyltransferase family 39 protein, partial [Pyrinomonadaceae bacterium]
MFPDELFVGSDQVEYIRHARNFASGDPGGLLDTYWPPFFPFVLGLAYLFSNDLVLPSVAVAVLFGSLAVPLIYYFVRQSYGHREGLIAGVLAVFYPHLLNSVFDLGSENVYLVLIILCLFTGWKAITSDSLLYYALAGGLVGLAYLTRPEAFAYTAFFIGVVLFRNIWKKEQFIKRSLIYGGTFLIAFLVFAAPYLVYLKGEMGRWTISSKTEINTVMGDYTNPAAVDGDRLINPTLSLRTGADLLRSFSFNMVAINKSLPYLIPLGVMIFISLGLFATDWTSTRAKREAYLISFCLLTIVG